MTVTSQTNTTLSEIASALAERDHFVIGGHVSPDGDCLGSALGLAWALRQLGKQVTCVLARDEEPPSDLMFLPGADGLVPAARFEGPCECFIAEDVPYVDLTCAVLGRRRPSRSPWITMRCPGP